MTAQQCAERQAARDNLVSELVEALEWLMMSESQDGWCAAVANATKVLLRAKEQAEGRA